MRVEDYYKLNNEQIKAFDEYAKMIIEWNKMINLTSITDMDEIELKHFIDSLTISKYIKDGEKVVDVGTGAGFPGIPLKIYNNTLNVTLVDSLNKRIKFLENVIEKLKLSNVVAVHARAEEVGRSNKYRESFDVATSRAVANLSVLVEYLLPLAKVGGKCICMKGPNIEDEINGAKNAIKILGGEIERIDNFELPNSDIKRNIIVINKIKKCDIKYPRKPGEPLKKPLI